MDFYGIIIGLFDPFFTNLFFQVFISCFTNLYQLFEFRNSIDSLYLLAG